MLKRSLSAALSLAILLAAPGTGFYDAAAAVLQGREGAEPVNLRVAAPEAGLAVPIRQTGMEDAPAAMAAALPGETGAESPEPDRAPVKVELPAETLAAMTPAQREDAQAVAAMMEKRLFTWAKFAINLPGTIFDGKTGPIIDVGSLFKAPTDDEVEKLALPRRGFDAAQLADIRQNASFSVASRDYPGQTHIWKLGGLLQKGRAANAETLQNHEAAALEEVMVSIPNRLTGEKPLSFRLGTRDFFRGLREAASLLVGLKENQPAYSSDEIEQQIDEKRNAAVAAAPGVADPALYLLKQESLREVYSALERVERQSAAAWEKDMPARREQMIAELRKQGVPEKEIPQRLADGLAQAAQDLFYGGVLQDQKIEKTHAGLGRLLVNHGKAVQIVRAGETRFAEAAQKERDAYLEKVRREHPVLARVTPLIEKRADALVRNYYNDLWLIYHEKSILPEIEKAGFAQEAAAFRAELAFNQTQAQGLRGSLASAIAPKRQFHWAYLIWRKSHWKIIQNKETGRFYADKVNVRTVSSGSWLWRLQNLAHRSASWFKNGVHWLLATNLYNGPLGLRSLVSYSAFHYRWTVDPETGALVQTAAVQETLLSRIRNMRAQWRKIIADHESKNNYGIFGKNMERIGLFFAADIPLLLLGPLTLGVFQPTLTATNILLSGALTATALLWAPTLATVAWAAQAVLYDTTGLSRYRLLPLLGAILSTAIDGVAQSIASLIAVPFHAALSCAELVAGGARFAGRSVYDAALFPVIKRYANVPGRDSRFLVKRVAGPGLSSEYFFQVDPNLAVVALWASLEQDVLARYSQNTTALAGEPSRAYKEFADVFTALTGADNAPAKNAPGYAEIHAKEQAILKRLDQAARPRQELYEKLLKVPGQGRIKLTVENLDKTLRMASVLAQKFYTGVFKAESWSAEQIQAFWAGQKLDRDDWVGLASAHLAGIFGAEFLIPLEQTDKTLRVEVKTPTLDDYARGLEKGVLPEDLANVKLGGLGSNEEPAEAKIPRASSRDLVRGALGARNPAKALRD